MSMTSRSGWRRALGSRSPSRISRCPWPASQHRPRSSAATSRAPAGRSSASSSARAWAVVRWAAWPTRSPRRASSSAASRIHRPAGSDRNQLESVSWFCESSARAFLFTSGESLSSPHPAMRCPFAVLSHNCSGSRPSSSASGAKIAGVIRPVSARATAARCAARRRILLGLWSDPRPTITEQFARIRMASRAARSETSIPSWASSWRGLPRRSTGIRDTIRWISAEITRRAVADPRVRRIRRWSPRRWARMAAVAQVQGFARRIPPAMMWRIGCGRGGRRFRAGRGRRPPSGGGEGHL